MKYPQHLLSVIENFKRLPGVGTKTAERFAFYLVSCPQSVLTSFGTAIKDIPKHLQKCPECGCLSDHTCTFCTNVPSTEKIPLCVVASPKDVFAIEETREFYGLYYVIENLFSPLEDKSIESVGIDRLKQFIKAKGVQEVIIALDSTLEGDATALLLKQELADLPVEISRLAFGLPMGSSLDFVDGNTLTRAFLGRAKF